MTAKKKVLSKEQKEARKRTDALIDEMEGDQYKERIQPFSSEHDS